MGKLEAGRKRLKIQVSTRDMLSKIVENTVFVLLGVCVTRWKVNFGVEREREREGKHG